MARILGFSAALAVFLPALSPAFGAGRQSRGKAQTQEKAARKACLTGDYAAGVAILADLFVDSQDPVYVYNQGRCLEQNTRFKEAIARFEEYLRLGETAKLPAEDRESARKHIEDCKAKLADEQGPAVSPPALAQPSSQPVPQATATEQSPPITIVEKPKPAAGTPGSGRGLVIGGIVTGSVGVAAVVTGVILNLKVNSMVDDMEKNTDAYTASKNSTKTVYQTAGWVSYGVGAACIATGAVLFAIGVSRNRASGDAAVALVPAVAPGQAGVVLRGEF